jgi:hypothetical protein
MQWGCGRKDSHGSWPIRLLGLPGNYSQHYSSSSAVHLSGCGQYVYVELWQGSRRITKPIVA